MKRCACDKRLSLQKILTSCSTEGQWGICVLCAKFDEKKVEQEMMKELGAQTNGQHKDQ